jgi:hypothetical protein
VSRRRDDNSDASVIPDDRQEAHIAVEHLAQLGHRRIAHIAGSSDISRGVYRLEGSQGAYQGIRIYGDDGMLRAELDRTRPDWMIGILWGARGNEAPEMLPIPEQLTQGINPSG